MEEGAAYQLPPPPSRIGQWLLRRREEGHAPGPRREVRLRGRQRWTYRARAME